jgi:hypothetical protein
MPGPPLAEARQTDRDRGTQQSAKGRLWGGKEGGEQTGAVKFAMAAGISAGASTLSMSALCGWVASVLGIRILVRAGVCFCAADLMGITAGFAIDFMLSWAWV